MRVTSRGWRRKQDFSAKMWFQVLPGIAAMGVCSVIPRLTTACVHAQVHERGKENRVAIFTNQQHLMERDRHILGVNCHYVSKDLENTD
ncbi:NADH dehydrogenase [ubiquinone] 1 alpha subcomplex subunit 1-like [Tupaia chinensis]|uniref:NADH dehydrogenase [ubiquinone] 1 alpha subcomplex subunit 1-like n=1 Tax=Tupaia chinensis TaxID=246437 RepID=UPI00070400D3|nr:NADH dehydrogenase [ubiquinone] 1 alpha subcomplex subunit 1-like [Tupaia chinensis]